MPPPQVSEEVKYEHLYARPFIEPRNYIKSSDTVEETLSCLYDMTTEDDEYLKKYNSTKKPASAQLSEDDFERIMELFEVTAAEQAPFAAVDNTIVSWDVMSQHLVTSPISKLQGHAKQVYEYWKSRRQETGSKGLHPSLKFETPGQQEHDDMDPYVCFRRREVRQTRKTRQRDAQVAEKLKKLRRELEDGRQLIVMSHQRELLKREMLNTERLLFESRARLKEKKVRLGIKENDEDLYNTKPVKRKAAEVAAPAKAAPHTQLRLAVRPEGRPAEQELVQLSDKMEEKHEEFLRDIAAKAETHRAWNHKHVDLTEAPLSSPRVVEESSFRPAKTQFLPTPPASASVDSMEVDEESNEAALASKTPTTPFFFRGLSPEPEQHMPEYRRRIGRNGRLWIDRRNVSGLASPPSDSDTQMSDRFKYDQDDSDDEQPVYRLDPYDTRPMKFRASIPLHIYRQYRGPEASATSQIASAARPALPQPPQAPGLNAGAAQTPSQAQQPQQPQQSPPRPLSHQPTSQLPSDQPPLPPRVSAAQMAS